MLVFYLWSGFSSLTKEANAFLSPSPLDKYLLKDMSPLKSCKKIGTSTMSPFSSFVLSGHRAEKKLVLCSEFRGIDPLGFGPENVNITRFSQPVFNSIKNVIYSVDDGIQSVLKMDIKTSSPTEAAIISTAGEDLVIDKEFIPVVEGKDNKGGDGNRGNENDPNDDDDNNNNEDSEEDKVLPVEENGITIESKETDEEKSKGDTTTVNVPQENAPLKQSGNIEEEDKKEVKIINKASSSQTDSLRLKEAQPMVDITPLTLLKNLNNTIAMQSSLITRQEENSVKEISEKSLPSSKLNEVVKVEEKERKPETKTELPLVEETHQSDLKTDNDVGLEETHGNKVTEIEEEELEKTVKANENTEIEMQLDTDEKLATLENEEKELVKEDQKTIEMKVDTRLDSKEEMKKPLLEIKEEKAETKLVSNVQTSKEAETRIVGENSQLNVPNISISATEKPPLSGDEVNTRTKKSNIPLPTKDKVNLALNSGFLTSDSSTPIYSPRRVVDELFSEFQRKAVEKYRREHFPLEEQESKDFIDTSYPLGVSGKAFTTTTSGKPHLEKNGIDDYDDDDEFEYSAMEDEEEERIRKEILSVKENEVSYELKLEYVERQLIRAVGDKNSHEAQKLINVLEEIGDRYRVWENKDVHDGKWAMISADFDINKYAGYPMTINKELQSLSTSSSVNLPPWNEANIKAVDTRIDLDKRIIHIQAFVEILYFATLRMHLKKIASKRQVLRPLLKRLLSTMRVYLKINKRISIEPVTKRTAIERIVVSTTSGKTALLNYFKSRHDRFKYVLFILLNRFQYFLRTKKWITAKNEFNRGMHHRTQNTCTYIGSFVKICRFKDMGYASNDKVEAAASQYDENSDGKKVDGKFAIFVKKKDDSEPVLMRNVEFTYNEGSNTDGPIGWEDSYSNIDSSTSNGKKRVKKGPFTASFNLKKKLQYYRTTFQDKIKEGSVKDSMKSALKQTKKSVKNFLIGNRQ